MSMQQGRSAVGVKTLCWTSALREVRRSNSLLHGVDLCQGHGTMPEILGRTNANFNENSMASVRPRPPRPTAVQKNKLLVDLLK